MTARRPQVAVLAAACALAATGCGQESDPSAVPATAEALAELRRADPDAARLVDGGRRELVRRLRALRGRPVVVNQWASWCGPCRFEFPLLQRVAQSQRGRIAFLGVNTRDSARDARAFLARLPTPFAHVSDPDGRAAALFGGRAWPTTALYDRRGRLAFVHQGPYLTDADLVRDVRRYAP